MYSTLILLLISIFPVVVKNQGQDQSKIKFHVGWTERTFLYGADFQNQQQIKGARGPGPPTPVKPSQKRCLPHRAANFANHAPPHKILDPLLKCQDFFYFLENLISTVL